ncbi:MAG: hypothetical protein LLG14_06765 [Nocardiaceae bacterium]|nr:hypothetical protein [Nocardiaceae bacterium]
MTTFLRLLGIIGAHALVQSLLILGDPVPTFHWSFALTFATSFCALVAALWAITAVMAGNWDWQVLAAVVGTVALAAAAGILMPVLTPLVLTVGIALACCIANRVKPLDFVRTNPVRTVVAFAGTAIGIVLLGIAAVGLGFLVTGAPGAFATWLVAGWTYVTIVRVWTIRSSDAPIVRV